MPRSTSLFMTILVGFFFPVTAALAGGASFRGLGALVSGDYFESEANAISGDGTVVVGRTISDKPGYLVYEPFRWTSEEGMVGLGILGLGNSPGSGSHDSAYGVSADGRVVVGMSDVGEGFRWTSTGGMTALGARAAFSTSANGAVVVGQTIPAFDRNAREAFRWTASNGVEGLGDLPGSSFLSSANAVSADGLVVVGLGFSALGGVAFRWTLLDGMVALGDLPGGAYGSSASATSADGFVVVGVSDSEFGSEAFRWTYGGEMVGLGSLPSDQFYSEALATSADGSVVVGRSNLAGPGSVAFVWTTQNGMRSLQDILVNELDVDLGDWALDEATGVSADGRVIVGTGKNPDYQTEAWIATIPTGVNGSGAGDGSSGGDDPGEGQGQNGDGEDNDGQQSGDGILDSCVPEGQACELRDECCVGLTCGEDDICMAGGNGGASDAVPDDSAGAAIHGGGGAAGGGTCGVGMTGAMLLCAACLGLNKNCRRSDSG